MPRSLVALGSNMGDRAQALRAAVRLLEAHPHVSQVEASRYFETAPIGGQSGQQAFLNGALKLETTLTPHSLHAVLVDIENKLGRRRLERWGPRAIDLDLLLYDALVLDDPNLQIPHPRMAFRRFVLAPAVEVAAEMVHPTSGWSIARLWEHLNSAPPYFALVGPPGSGKTALADALAKRLNGRLLVDPAAHLGPNRPFDSAGHAYSRQIQFLDRRGESLDCERFSAGNPPVISDFYWDQCLAYARRELAVAPFQDFCRAVTERSQRIARPKLLVALGLGRGNKSPGSELPSGDAAQVREALLEVTRRADAGPVLYLEASNRQSWDDEIAAAILATQ